MTSAFWKRLDVPGCDTARLDPLDDGWRLSGAAVFLEGVATRLEYEVVLAADWTALGGRVTGLAGDRRIDRHVVRQDGRWSLDGRPSPELDDLVDLDFGFTPATNMPQIRRQALAVGQTAEFPVAWMDIAGDLTRLLQIYRRTGPDAYDYQSPAGAYRATLQIADDGFAREYPTLWTRLG